VLDHGRLADAGTHADCWSAAASTPTSTSASLPRARPPARPPRRPSTDRPRAAASCTCNACSGPGSPAPGIAWATEHNCHGRESRARPAGQASAPAAAGARRQDRRRVHAHASSAIVRAR